MYSAWRRDVRDYIDSKVGQTIEWLYNIEVSTLKVGYPKCIAQNNRDFNNVQVWTYGYLLRRINEVVEEYEMNVEYVGEEYTSSKCPIHGRGMRGKG